MSLKEKLEQFNNLCGDWDFRNIDMTDPHLEGILVNESKIEVYCELFSTELDDYVSCVGGTFKNNQLISQFRKLNLNSDKDVLNFISNIENLIDWDKVSEDLYNQIKKETTNDFEM